MSSPNRSTSDIEDAFSSINILNYTSVSSDSFPASSGSSSFNSSENSTDLILRRHILPRFRRDSFLKPRHVEFCKGGFQPERLARVWLLGAVDGLDGMGRNVEIKNGDSVLESMSIRRIQCIGYGVLGFLGVGTTFDIFQNIHPDIFNTAY
ncbi:hypothetical protein Tco_0878028 [Tanacetum coccineum]|uniref:Uncharacterized protein n=1 Tax=Tanacetum coccineum TaxID=301880 RepID=A0ABQ5BZR8_9ASTR